MAAGALSHHQASPHHVIESNLVKDLNETAEINDDQIGENSESTAFRTSALGVKRFFCEQCEFSSFFEQTLVDHKISDHEGGLPHFCNRCDRRFKERQDVEHHILVEHLHPSAYWKNKQTGMSWVKKKNFSCDECGSRFSQQWLLNKHMKLHSMQRQCICVICEVSFPNESLLAEHAREVHSDFSAEAPNSSQYVCKWCRRRFVETKGLTKHEALCKVVKANNDTSPRRKRRALSDEEDNCFVNGETNSIPKASMSSKFVPPQGLNEVLPQMPEITDSASNEINALTCKFCDEVFEQLEYLDDHIEEMHQVKESSMMPKYPMGPPVDHFQSNLGEELSLSDYRTTISFNDQEDLLSTISEVQSIDHFHPPQDAVIEGGDLSSAIVQAPPSKPISEPATTQPSSRSKTNRCLICLQSFDNFVQLKDHVAEVHKPRKKPPSTGKVNKQPRKCLICKLMLPDIDALKVHVNTVHSSTTTAPQQNQHSQHSATEAHQLLFTNHLTTPNMNDSMVTCFPDFSEFESETNELDLSSIDQNLLLLHNTSSAAASTSSMTDENIVNIMSPPQPQNQLKPEYKCNQCNRTFKYKWNYEKDQEMHRKQKAKAKSAAVKSAGKSWMLDCPHCSETFVDKIARIQHIKKAHETQPKHKCESCNEEFSRKHLLISHIEKEHNILS